MQHKLEKKMVLPGEYSPLMVCVSSSFITTQLLVSEWVLAYNLASSMQTIDDQGIQSNHKVVFSVATPLWLISPSNFEPQNSRILNCGLALVTRNPHWIGVNGAKNLLPDKKQCHCILVSERSRKILIAKLAFWLTYANWLIKDLWQDMSLDQ